MGFYLRKSVSVGPFRFNFSGSGVNVSAGVTGLRVGSGPRGNYVHLGRGGIYYRHTFPADSVPAPRHAPPMLPIARENPPLQEIESGGAASIVDSSSEELLDEIRAKRRKLGLRPFAIAGALLLVFVASSAVWAMGAAALLGVALIVAAGYRDRIAKTVVILYDFEPQVEEAFRRFTEWAQALAGAGRTWHVAASGRVHDRKYHAGASDLVQRHVTTVRTAEPPFVKTNVPVLSIGAGRQTLYFLPDRLLVYDASGIGAISYRTLEISASKQRFIEDGGVTADATVVDHTWRYVNKSGGPDRRFRDNPRVPICLYDELSFRTSTGLNEVIQVSHAGLGEGFAAAVRYLGSVTA
ncbi:MAG TPA: DUF4236 domain-containing protein [Thermoanaerobaculia bacterium]|nr:DUF4236 domain-containing protein [Thermoanaerobaculia bacterium]